MASLLYRILPSSHKGSRRWVVLFFLILFLSLLPIAVYRLVHPSESKADWYSSGGTWQYRKKITINSSKVSGSSNHTNFAALIKVNDASLIDGAQSTGNDILFTSSDGTTKLDHEIDTFSNGEVLAWVEIPTLDYNDDTIIYMYYGNPNASDQSNASGVFDTTDDYVGVWHLGEAATDEATSATFYDSTGNSNDLSQSGSYDNAGRIGSGQEFDGTNDYATIADNSTLSFGGTTMTIQAWVYVPGSHPDYAGVAGKDYHDGSHDDPFFEYGLNLVFGKTDYFMARGTGGGDWIRAQDSSAISVDNWHFIYGIYDGSNIKSYLDGTEVGTWANTTAIQDYVGPFNIGANGGYSENFKGTIDEVRVTKTNRSTDWMVTEYTNQSDPDGFITVGGFETYQGTDQPVAYWKFDEGQGSTANNSGQDSTTGSITGAQWQSSDQCISGTCLYFDGSGDYIDFGNTYDHTTDEFSFSLWMRTSNTTSDMYILSKGTASAGATGHGYTLRIPNTWGEPVPLYYIQADGSAADTANDYYAVVRDGKWHQVTVTRAASRIDMYLDGNLLASDSSISTSDITTTANLRIGSYSGAAAFFNGFIDEVKMFDYALTSSQVKTNYADEASDTGAGAVLGSSSPSFLTDGLIGYWPMDDHVSGDAQTVADSSGNANTGTTDYGANTTGMDCTVTGKYANGCDFDGSDDDIYVSNIELPTQDFTYATWVNLDGSASYYSIFDASSGSGNEFTLLYDTASFDVYIDHSYLFSSSAITAGEWAHVAVTRSGPDIKLYINGVEDSSGTDGTTLDFGSCGLSIGADVWSGCNSSFGASLDGQLDEVRVYNRALNASEIQSLYNWAPGPILYLPLNENSGTSTVYDRSGNGFTGTLTDISENEWVPGKYGSAIHFDGSGDRITIADDDRFSIDRTGQMTIGFWANFDSFSAAQDPISKWAASNAEWEMRINNDQTMRSYVLTSTGSTMLQLPYAANSFNTGEWYYIVHTIDINDPYIRGYIDGKFLSEDLTSSGSYTNGTSAVTIGERSDGYGDVAGVLDEIKIWNYILTPEQMTEAMNAGHPAGGSPIGSQTVFYTFDEGYGSTANNTIEPYSSITGSISGATWSTGSNCKYSKCLDFDGTSNVVTVTNTNAIDMDVGLANGFSISTWVNVDSDGENGVGNIFTKGTNAWCRTDSESGGYVDLECSLDLVTSDATLNVTDALTIDQWHHVVLTYQDDSDDEIELYVDGVLVGSSTNGSGAPSSDSNNLLIGGSTSANFDGTLDDFKIYAGALTADQVLIDMNANSAINLGTGSRIKDDYTFTPPDPVLHWKFDENTGSGAFTVYDSTGNNLNGTAQSSMEEADWVPGVYSSALDFDGSNDNVSIANTTAIDFDDDLSSGFSFAGWIYIRSDGGSNQGRFFQKGNTRCDTRSEAGSDVRIACNVDMTGTDIFMNRSGVAMNQWHHFVFTFDGVDTAILYLDGANYGSGTGTGSLNTDTSTLYIGGGVNAYDGLMDDFKIFASELTPAQVVYEYNKGKPLVHYRFDECSGSTVYDVEQEQNGTIPSQTSGTNTSVGTCDSGNGNEMWDNGSTGKFNSALDFDGTDDRFYASDITLPTGDFAYSFWLKRGSTKDYHTILDGSSGSGNEFTLILNNSNTLDVYVNGSYLFSSATTFAAGEWTHVVVSRNGSTISLYFNGRLDSNSGSDGTALDFSTCGLSVGADVWSGCNSSFGGYLDGTLDEMKIYNYALSQAQVLNLYNGEAVRFE